jgi:hypothetical protein
VILMDTTQKQFSLDRGASKTKFFQRKAAGSPPRRAAPMVKTTRKRSCFRQPHLRNVSW